MTEQNKKTEDWHEFYKKKNKENKKKEEEKEEIKKTTDFSIVRFSISITLATVVYIIFGLFALRGAFIWLLWVIIFRALFPYRKKKKKVLVEKNVIL